jgi:ribosomal protein S18 acetylase RimI-like enzyme
VHDLGRPDYADYMVRPPWLDGRLDPARDTLLVRAADGTSAAYVQSLDGEVLGRVMPAHRGRGLGSLLLDHVEGRADGALEQEVGGENEAAGAAARAPRLGARLDQLVLPSDARRAGAPSGLAAGVTVRPLERGRDELPVHAMLVEAFGENREGELPPLADWIATDLETPRFDAACTQVAERGGVVVGLCLAYPDPGEAWVKLLAVGPSMRGRGLGLALLHAAFGDLRRRGHPSVGLEVDDANPTGARRLYLRAGMVQERRNRLLRRPARS